MPRAAGYFCCLVIMSRLPPSALAPEELKIPVTFATLPRAKWLGGRRTRT